MNQDVNLLKYLATVDKSIGRLYEKLIKELAKVGATIDDFASGAFFSFKDYPQIKERVEKILDDYSQALEAKITNGMTEAINMSYLANTTFLKDYSKLSDKALKTQRETATKSFIQSRTKSAYGLGLSDRVWNYTQQAKAEFEAGMSELIEEGITAGISAEELGRKLRSKLNNPDMVYRRYHLKKLTETGKKDVVEWRKKVVDEDGKVHFIKTEMDLVGRGVYRSSRKNSLRLAATEINMAYRYADSVRWQSEPFIRGIRIRLSGNHTLNGKPFTDICDDLKGDYPKTFMWSGWHPRCRCIATPILIPQEEMDEIYKLPEDEYQNYRPKDLITEMPDKFKSWFAQNKDKIEASIERGTQPYFIRDNKSIIDKLFNVSDIHILSESKLQSIIDKERKRLIRQDVEHMSIINRKGAVLYKTSGTSSDVRFSDEVAKIAENNIVTHNHPSGKNGVGIVRLGYSFSSDDIYEAVRCNVLQIIAESPYYRYMISRPNIGWIVSPVDIRKRYAELYSKIRKEYSKSIEYHQSMNIVQHLTMKALSKEYGFIYEYKKIK